MTKAIPESLRAHILPFDWDVRRVWSRAAECLRRPVADYAYLLDLPLWSSIPGRGMLFDISPRAVIEAPQRSTYQAERLARADLRYPIDVLVLEGRHWILDGVHRIAKHVALGVPTLIVRLHDASALAAIRIEPEGHDD